MPRLRKSPSSNLPVTYIEAEERDLRAVVDAAWRGDPIADRALRRLIHQAMETDRFQELPLAVRGYACWAIISAPL